MRRKDVVDEMMLVVVREAVDWRRTAVVMMEMMLGLFAIADEVVRRLARRRSVVEWSSLVV